ncbi:hypothetical protein M405DRAFT_862157 [Rhizopogon salebrosus TDB-379]|nr:hypothetical protein M405DRAFT_862157 [Rhizopogon salebrosus TDB-379]
MHYEIVLLAAYSDNVQSIPPHLTYLQCLHINENHETDLHPTRDSQKKPKVKGPPLTQLTTLEDEVTTSLQDLKARNRIFGELPSLDEFLEPVEEQKFGDSLAFEGGDKAIVAAVKREMAEKVDEVIEVESAEDEDSQAEPEVSRAEALGLCQPAA